MGRIEGTTRFRAGVALIPLLAVALLVARPPMAAARPTDPGDPNAYQVPEHLPPDCGPHFCVHWVDSGVDAPAATDTSPHDGIPDLVDAILADAERNYPYQVGALGWPAPKSDGAAGDAGNPAENGKVDFYVKNLAAARPGFDVLGLTEGELDPATQTAAGYVLVSNSFAKEIDLVSPVQTVEVVVAHEFNHVLQLAYDGRLDDWMAESTAEWMAFHQLDTLIGQEGAFAVWADSSTIPLASNGLAPNSYGYPIWNWWLMGRYGEPIVRNAWADLRTASPQGSGVGAYDQAIRAAGGPGFSTEFARFAAAAAEINTPAFPSTDSVIYPEVRRHGNLKPGHGVRLRLDHTSFALYDCENERGLRIRKGKSLTMSASAARGSFSAFALIGRTRHDTVKVVLRLAPRGGHRTVTLRDPGRFKRITAALINADGGIAGGSPSAWSYTADRVPMSATLRLAR